MNDTLLRMRRNSLDLNSFRADFCRRSMKSSPFSSTTSSFISSVVFALISFISSSRFAIMTTLPGLRDDNAAAWAAVTVQTCSIRTPLKEDFGRAPRGRKASLAGEAIETLSIFPTSIGKKLEIVRE